MSLRRPSRARVDPDPDAMVIAREQLKSLPHNAVNIRATMAHHPLVARGVHGLAGTVLTEFETPRRQRELIILRMGWNCNCVYEFGQHTMYGMANGVTEAEVSAVTRPLISHPWADDDRLLLEMTDELYADDCVTDATWEQLAARWNTMEIMEFVTSALTYRTVSGFLNTFGVQLDEGVPGWPS